MAKPGKDREARCASLEADDLRDDADGSEQECLLPQERPQVAACLLIHRSHVAASCAATSPPRASRSSACPRLHAHA